MAMFADDEERRCLSCLADMIIDCDRLILLSPLQLKLFSVEQTLIYD